jgi:hypothetical protein
MSPFHIDRNNEKKIKGVWTAAKFLRYLFKDSVKLPNSSVKISMVFILKSWMEVFNLRLIQDLSGFYSTSLAAEFSEEFA